MEWHIRKLNIYYCIGIPALLLLLLGAYIFKLSLSSTLFLLTTYVWGYALNVPNLKKYLIKRKDRFSFLKMSYKINSFTKKKWYPITKHLPPLILILILFMLAGEGNPLYSLIGILVFELVFKLFTKFK